MAFRTYTVAEARALLPELVELSREFVALRADTTELADAIRRGEPSPLGGPPEYKAGEARVHEIMEWIVGRGLEPKGMAPAAARPGRLHESITVRLTNGKPLVVSQSADPASDRKVTVELTATILDAAPDTSGR